MYDESLIIETINGWFNTNYTDYNVSKIGQSFEIGIQRRAARKSAALKKERSKRPRYRRSRRVGRKTRQTPSSDDDTDDESS